jgi:hypothetical protein
MGFLAMSFSSPPPFRTFLITSTAMLRGLTVQAELQGGPCRWPSLSNLGSYLHESRKAP